MRQINKAPLNRQGNRGPAVEDIQHLLNVRDDNSWSQSALLVEDGIFGPLTRAKVVEFQRSAALQPDGIVGPNTCAFLFAPQADRVDQAQGIALNWTFLARAAVRTLRDWVLALQFARPGPGGNLATCVEAYRVHFKVDLPAPNPNGPGSVGGNANPLDLIQADDRLQFMERVYDDVQFVLESASIREGRVFYSVGPKQCQLINIGQVSAGVRNVPSGQGTTMLVVFPPSFHVTTNPIVTRTISQQASTVLHECCHYVRPRSEGAVLHVGDFAYGHPAFAGQPAGKGAHNYQQLTADEALKNAECYNLFAEHITFGRDTRFGRLSDDLASFTCGSKDTCG